MTARHQVKISAAAAAELMRKPDEADLAVFDARGEIVDECVEEVLELILAKFPDVAIRRVKGLRGKISRILEKVMSRTIAVEISNPDRKKQRARSRGRRGGRVRSNQSRKKLVLELAKQIDAKTPSLSLNEISKRIAESISGVEVTTIRKYLAGFRGKPE